MSHAAKKEKRTMTQANPLQPAIDALNELKTDVLDRVGQQGGNLNKRMRSNINTISLALNQFSTITSMNSTMAQQSQVIAKVTNDLSRLLMAAGKDSGDQDNGGDEDRAETKGE
jgi:hypothetical protein